MNVVSRTPVLWGLLVANVLLGVAFGLFRDGVGGAYLDMVSDPDRTQAMLAALSPEQAGTHVWVTLIIDTLFPLTYGGLFAGLALRFFPRWGPWTALPAILAILVDLTENMVQVLALTGGANALDAKVWITPLKFGLFQVAAGLAFAGLAVGFYERFIKRRA